MAHFFCKKNFKRIITVFLAFIFLGITSLSYAIEPRVFAWGLAGSEELARLDFMAPFSTNNLSYLFYTDIQGEVDTKSNWYSGIGIGYRGRRFNRLVGGYAFIDRNYTDQHNTYYILNPGIETLGQAWDARINGYFPVGQRRHIQEGLPFIADTCGDNIQCETLTFSGHQELLPIFHKIEEAGPGVDAEIGSHFGRNHDFSIFGGGYYFRFPNINDIKGLEARMVIPLKPAIALTVEASYDSEAHGAIVGGIRIQAGHLSHRPLQLEDRLYDPIPRNLATIKNGLGAPVARKQQFDHFVVVRDNIFFFNGIRGTTFEGINTGTFENPLGPDQFTQTTVDGINIIVPNANLYFNQGTYIVNPASPAAPNASISISLGQSLFGRTRNYQCSAIGDQRPTFLGEIELLAGNNALDSIILSNNIAIATVLGAPVDLVALNIQNALGVSICNSRITAEFNSTNANGGGVVSVSGISANSSVVAIKTSSIKAVTSVQGANPLGVNTATAIGNTNGSTNDNQFTITDSEIIAQGIQGSSAGFNAAVGIGGIGALVLPPPPPTTFENNTFTISNTQIESEAFTGGLSNTFSTLSTGIGGVSNNANISFQTNTFTLLDTQIASQASNGAGEAFSTGVGVNSAGVGTGLFNANTFSFTNSQISSNVVGSSGGSSVLLSTGIGANSGDTTVVKFGFNDFTLVNSQITSSGNNLFPSPASQILIAGIGVNAVVGVGSASAAFDDNVFSIQQSTIDANSTTFPVAANLVTGIGTNALGAATSAVFGAGGVNTFTITEAEINSTGEINGANVGENRVVGVGSNASAGATSSLLNTVVNIFTSDLTVLAHIQGNNSGVNTAIGLQADAGSTINFVSSVGLVSAIVDGANTGTNTATAFVENGGTVVGGASIQTVTLP